MKKSVLVGMSGGIDSAMTAKLLQEQGYKVHGVCFNFYADDDNLHLEKEKVETLANKLGVDLTYYDAREIFREELIGYFTSFYSNGLTPSPCVYCNANVKLKLLSELADKWGYSEFATGHYIQLDKQGERIQVIKGADSKKDQSYYMWEVPQYILKNFLTPLGGKTKEEIKAYAIENGFAELVKKKESTGLCFAQGRSIPEMLEDYMPELLEKVGEGSVFDRTGKLVGTHKGYFYYTIGQKSNMNLTIEGKPSVVEIKADQNALIVDHWDSLYVKSFQIRNALFTHPDKIEEEKGVVAKVRGLGLNPEGEAKITGIGEARFQVELENPAWAPAAGQSAVFYKGEKLLGGGLIC